MKSFSIEPAQLDLTVVKGDEFSVAFDFDTDLTSYTWESIVFKSGRTVNTSHPGGVDTQGDTVETFTTSVTNASNGELTISLTETQTAALSESQLYRWRLRGVAPGSVTRTYISGIFTLRAP